MRARSALRKRAARVQLVIDWDGTVTESDTLLLALQHFVPAAVLEPVTERVDAALAAGKITLREVMAAEFRTLTAPLDAVVAFIVEHARVRPGFAELVRRFDPLIVSTSFHETIEPILAREGVTARVRASRVDADPDGWRIRWISDEDCTICGEPCKRSALPHGAFTYVGDGYSDRCAARAAERVFARDGLAVYLDRLGVAYEPYRDLRDVEAALS
jgi:2-hydroxy-3-keto-5-methylthiopentenyl-1-phosphate phosphatase